MQGRKVGKDNTRKWINKWRNRERNERRDKGNNKI